MTLLTNNYICLYKNPVSYKSMAWANSKLTKYLRDCNKKWKKEYSTSYKTGILQKLGISILWVSTSFFYSSNLLSTSRWSHTFSNNKASFHGWDSERKLLQATRGPHVPIALATTTASTAAMSRGPTSLDAPQKVGYNFSCMLSLVRRPHNLCYSVWWAAIIWWKRENMLIRD